MSLIARFAPYLILAAFAAGGGITYYIDSLFDDAARAELLEKQAAAHKAAVKRAIEQSEKVRKLDNELLSDAADAKDEVDKAHDVFIKEVVKYVPQVSEAGCDCNLRIGAIRLLNAVRAGRAGGELRSPAGGTDEEGRTPSSITGLAEIQYHADCARRYNDLAADHNALIEWLRRHREISN